MLTLDITKNVSSVTLDAHKEGMLMAKWERVEPLQGLPVVKPG